ncbi:MAG TPA: hypothetical protein VGL77_17650 [Armatimonadota bacterium]|jgi:hypothetical protein
MILTAKAATQTRASHHAGPLWRLLWKEFSERRWWAICWALVILAVSLVAHGQRFCGDVGWMRWNSLSLVFAGVVGLGGYTGELKRGRALFLFTRAVRWQEVLLAKVLFGAIMLLGVPLLAACIFRLTCPEPYRHFITLPNVLSGIGALARPAALCYLVGLACSVILPGLAGGTLAVISISLAIAVMLCGSELFWWLCYYLKLVNDTTPNIELMMGSVRVGILLFAILGVLWGGASALRSGLYRDYVQRVKLFAPRLIFAMLIGGLLGLCLPQSLTERLLLHWYPRDTNVISPGGSYAIVFYQQRDALFCIYTGIFGDLSGDLRTEVVRLADHAVLRRMTTEKRDNYLGSYNWYWITDSVAVGNSSSNTTHNTLLYHPDTGKIIPIAAESIGNPSPDGRFAVSTEVTREDNPRRYIRHLYFCNLDNGRTADVATPVTDDRYCVVWWESNDIVGYYSSAGYYGTVPNKRRHVPPFREAVHHLRVPQF